ncbi:MAG TPA: hydrogenase maturation protease [Kaistiaceae bacterium]|nr:hydrogenase maturation protease [Kaistiaceae bacterium]
MTRNNQNRRVVVLGIGNSLLTDDGVGIHVVDKLRTREDIGESVALFDGGTLGLALLPEIEDADGLIVVDAGDVDAAPGDVRSFEGEAFSRQIGGRKKTVHEVALADLMDAALLSGRAPRQCALVTVQPQSTEWGLTPTPAVAAAIPAACDTVIEIVRRWGA